MSEDMYDVSKRVSIDDMDEDSQEFMIEDYEEENWDV